MRDSRGHYNFYVNTMDFPMYLMPGDCLKCYVLRRTALRPTLIEDREHALRWLDREDLR